MVLRDVLTLYPKPNANPNAYPNPNPHPNQVLLDDVPIAQLEAGWFHRQVALVRVRVRG